MHPTLLQHSQYINNVTSLDAWNENFPGDVAGIRAEYYVATRSFLCDWDCKGEVHGNWELVVVVVAAADLVIIGFEPFQSQST